MNLFRYRDATGSHLGLETSRGRFDLGSVLPDAFASVAAWLALPDPLAAVREAARAATVPVSEGASLLAPLDTQEVWGAGVTYERSRVARKEESVSGGDCYDQVYTAERPELFLKATPRRVVGPGEAVRIRRDSTWNVPEPELTLVIAASGQIVGYTVGNDMSSRSIEGENPLYLPQAKMYDACCALGPVITLANGLDPSVLPIRLSVQRGGEIIFSGQTSTARMRRTPGDLAAFLFRELTFPDGVFLMTGTGIVPHDDFTLHAGDRVEITIEGIGTLANPVA